MKDFIFKYKWVIFFAIIAIHFVFKFYGVGDNSLWFDECYTVDLAQKPISEIIHIALYEDHNPPLYGIVMHFWVNAFGDSEVAVRSLSVVASALAAGFLFLLCLRFFNWQTSVFASLMFFTSNELYYYGQEARTYALIVLWVVLSYYLFLSLLEKPNILKAFLFAFVNACIFYSHFLSCFVLVIEALLLPFFVFRGASVVNDKDEITFSFHGRKKVLVYFIISGLILLGFLYPWIDRLLFLVSDGGKTFWLAKPTLTDLKTCVYDFFNGKLIYQIHVYSAVAFIALLFIKKFRPENFNWKLVLFSLLAGPGILYFNYVLAQHTPIFLKRYVLLTTLGFILTYAYLFSLLNIHYLIKIALFIVLSVFSFSKMVIPREALNDYNKVVPYLKSLQKDGTTLIINDMQEQFAYYYDKDITHITSYHLRNEALKKRDVFSPVNQTWMDEEDFSRYKDIYYTRSFWGYYDPQENIPKKLGAKYTWIEDISGYKGIKITHYTNPNYKPKTK